MEAVCRLPAGKGKANAKMQRIFLPPDARNDARTSYLCSPKTNPMKVIVDDKIPFIREALESLADEVVYAPGKDFTPALVRDADALVTRTRTRCDQSLLEGSRVRFIATATIGFDHIDTAWCREAGIAWANAPGCNADSVAQYLQSALLLWQQATGNTLRTLTLGIVGAGNVGTRVAAVARGLGMTVLLNDPPRQDREGQEGFCTLEELARRCDVLSFHVPLNRQGAYKTLHLADDAFFRTLQRRPLIVNTSRGDVVDTAALLRALDEGRVSDAVIDVWENEPDIDRRLLGRAFLATPHIAGYSADGKANATRMALDALCRFFHLRADYRIVPPPPPCPVIRAHSLTDACLQMYDPRRDCDALRAHPELFEKLRGDYPLRREKQAYTVEYL